MHQEELIPVRMVNEYVYCPRLAYLEWVQSEWAESADTVDGKFVHRRVDRASGDMPAARDMEPDESLQARSVLLSSQELGVVARFDLIEGEDGRVVPVDYKRGKRPHVARRAYDPERVQLCLQGLILREHGYVCSEGILYFAASRERVRVAFDEELVALARASVQAVRDMAAAGVLPEPLEDSPKCPRCSLVGICLPDEVCFLRSRKDPPRPLAVAPDDALPVYVQAYRGKVAKKNDELVITTGDDGTETRARLRDTSQLALLGNVYLTTPCLHELLRRQIPVCWYSYGGWFLGYSCTMGHKNVELRTAQYQASFDERRCLDLARTFVRAKIHNCRTLLRRNWRGEEKPQEVLIGLQEDRRRAGRARSIQELLGVEGAAAARYFAAFAGMLREDDGMGRGFDFRGRNRRPPTDPVNALLSFGYAMLVRTWSVTLACVGLDPYRGFYHQPRYGRPALALDMMESFRPLVVDSCVVRVINNGEIRPEDFIVRATGVALKDGARRKFIAAFERRLGVEITHPVFSYRVSCRRVLELQARLLGRHLLGEIPDYPDLTTR